MIVERPNTLDLCTTDDVGDSSFDVLPADGDASVFCDPPSGPITSPFFCCCVFPVPLLLWTGKTSSLVTEEGPETG